MKVKCRACHKSKPERQMEIYDVATDAYYCDQTCKDLKDEVVRDEDGFICD